MKICLTADGLLVKGIRQLEPQGRKGRQEGKSFSFLISDFRFLAFLAPSR